ncbi:glycosyltransferase family 61 protein [Nostoc sp.]
MRYKQVLKKLLLTGLEHLPISSEIIGSPKGFYENYTDFIKTSKNSKLQIDYIEIYPEHYIYRIEPKTIYEDIDDRFNKGYLGKEFKTPSAFVAIIENGRICGSGGSIISSDDKLILDLSFICGINGHMPAKHPLLQKLKLPNIVKINGTVSVLATENGKYNYFHWMFDVLPRIHLLKLTNNYNHIEKFVTNQLKYNFQQESLKIIGIPKEKIIESNENIHLKVDSLVVPSLPGIPGAMPLWVCEFLRRSFLFNPVIKQINEVEKIYITRRNANYRRVLNEDEIIQVLKKFDFTVLDPGDFTITEQVAIFSSAKIIISPHGAALTNLVFCNPGTKVLEIFSPLYVNTCYRCLCNQVNIEYYYLLGEGKTLSKDHPNFLDGSLVTNDILVNINSLYQSLQLLNN